MSKRHGPTAESQNTPGMILSLLLVGTHLQDALAASIANGLILLPPHSYRRGYAGSPDLRRPTSKQPRINSRLNN